MNDSTNILLHRFIDVANQCYSRNCQTETDFLDMASQSEFNSIVNQLPPVFFQFMGGYDLAERRCLVFIPYKDFPTYVPFDIVKITPVNRKFAEELTHRDYLGSIIGLGIVRDKFGDIIVKEDLAYVFVMKDISEYVVNNLSKVRNTMVNVELVVDGDFTFEPRYTEITGSVASLRLDAVIALGFGLSRNHIVSYIEDGRVFVNGRIITTNAYNLKENDIISVRKLGRIQFMNSITQTKKGRIMVSIRRMI